MRLSNGLRFRAVLIGLVAGLGLAGSANALTMENFVDSPFASGFNIGSPTPAFTMPVDYIFQGASGNPGVVSDVNFSTTQCLQVGGAGACQATLPAGVGPYTSIMTWTVTSTTVPIPAGGLLLFLSGLPGAAEGQPDYAMSDVGIVTSGQLAGTTLSDIEQILLPYSDSSFLTYLGFQVFNIGDSFTIGYTVTD